MQSVPASVIGGLASRESNGGDSLKDGYGDNKQAWGILQCDLKTSNLPCKTCGAYSCCHIEMMVSKVLVPFIQKVKKDHPSWKPEQQLQGGVAAYNFSPNDVRTWERLDVGTANGDYSNDVMARAQFLKKNYGWS
ncbi:hypothetical protein C0Q70_02772 [Pomacea canaliculata]|uniref:Lysozyme g n=1 Tax=Pomacea canaliculata TaxID=400727 RepID=A0A2T7PQU7_POMCA|nr:hypothetical protein C0Q70_02772 [Pomacea canaliculata]